MRRLWDTFLSNRILRAPRPDWPWPLMFCATDAIIEGLLTRRGIFILRYLICTPLYLTWVVISVPFRALFKLWYGETATYAIRRQFQTYLQFFSFIAPVVQRWYFCYTWLICQARHRLLSHFYVINLYSYCDTLHEAAPLVNQLTALPAPRTEREYYGDISLWYRTFYLAEHLYPNVVLHYSAISIIYSLWGIYWGLLQISQAVPYLTNLAPWLSMFPIRALHVKAVITGHMRYYLHQVMNVAVIGAVVVTGPSEIFYPAQRYTSAKWVGYLRTLAVIRPRRPGRPNLVWPGWRRLSDTYVEAVALDLCQEALWRWSRSWLGPRLFQVQVQSPTRNYREMGLRFLSWSIVARLSVGCLINWV